MSSRTTTAPSVPLPSRQHGNTVSSKPPVWPLNASTNDELPPAAKCDRDEPSRSGVCCKELTGDDERTLVDPDVLRDVVIGLSDGLTVPFALTAGLSSLGESKLVILGGIAELIAGALSMGIGGFLASQAERDHYRYLRKQTRARVLRSCEGEMEREVYTVLGPVGVDEKTSRAVAQCLMNVEVDSSGEGLSRSPSGSDTASRSSASDSESGLRWSQNVGMSAFLLKFGEGMEEVPTRRLYISAFTIGMGYFLGGLIPLLPYFLEPVAHIALIYSCIVTGIVLLIFGAVKARITGAAGQGVGGYLWGAVSTLLVGGAAAAAAYALVAILETD
ncbi:membrane fraction protein [Laetiporus sulphureus 93-53]|uniref:Membrane fraction protein n=1 Tax=Laetiporus sulphureus 93-53 TaxID=1314785 RepID=A0A165AWQ9_9APHY|nr:membrane fraction protein [Laetiporus sulphureus 93-53]KZS99801.1 membrane fraction protein [Laetiporus sulphureus 93-53]